MDCIFCKIIKGEIPSYKLYEDDKVVVIMDAYPNVDGHTLVIPKNHYETFLDLPDDLVNHINVIAKKYAISNMEKLNAKGITLLVNYGDSQKVKHYHLHLLSLYGTLPEEDVKEVFEVLNG